MDEAVDRLRCRECGYELTRLLEGAGWAICPECGTENIGEDRVAAPLKACSWPNPFVLVPTMLLPTLLFGGLMGLLAALGAWPFALLNVLLWLFGTVGFSIVYPVELVRERLPRRRRLAPAVGLVLAALALNMTAMALILMGLVAVA